MAIQDLLYLKSNNIWFGVAQKDINIVKMNQKPGWFPKPENNFSGLYLIDDQIYKMIHLNFLFGDRFKSFKPAHMVVLKPHLGNWAIACSELKTQLDMPMASGDKYQTWLNDEFSELLTHWFPVDLEKYIHSTLNME